MMVTINMRDGIMCAEMTASIPAELLLVPIGMWRSAAKRLDLQGE